MKDIIIIWWRVVVKKQTVYVKRYDANNKYWHVAMRCFQPNKNFCIYTNSVKYLKLDTDSSIEMKHRLSSFRFCTENASCFAIIHNFKTQWKTIVKRGGLIGCLVRMYLYDIDKNLVREVLND